MKKLGTASRATFVSPYLRRPLRPLDKVLSEREEQGEEESSTVTGLDGGDSLASATWSLPRKPAIASD